MVAAGREDSDEKVCESESDDNDDDDNDLEDKYWSSDEEDDSYDPRLICEDSLWWLDFSCCLGAAPQAPDTCTAFISGNTIYYESVGLTRPLTIARSLMLTRCGRHLWRLK
jgi:hypothetical protein